MKKAVIVDMDGTLALFGKENPYDRDMLKDKLNYPVAVIVWMLNLTDLADVKILIVSGRKNRYLKDTQKWLKKHKINYEDIFMPRADNDNRKDVIIKTEIYEKEIKGKYEVLFVLDDRDQVVELWRGLGLVCFQVADGNF